MSQLGIRAYVNDYLGSSNVGIHKYDLDASSSQLEYLGLVGIGVEHDIVCIDLFCVLICSMGDVLWLCEYMHDRNVYRN